MRGEAARATKRPYPIPGARRGKNSSLSTPLSSGNFNAQKEKILHENKPNLAKVHLNTAGRFNSYFPF